jgi:hypothetical protein
LPVVIIGSDAEGRVFSEETHTVVVSLHGAGIVSRQRLVADQEVILRVKQLNQEAEVRVVGEIAQQGTLYTYGVAFLEEGLDFWKMEFPEPAAWDGHSEALVLECGGCKSLVELRNGDFEYDICAIHGGLARFCDECGLLTVWRRSHEIAPKVREGARKAAVVKTVLPVAEPELAQEIVTGADEMEGTDRRIRVRAKVNLFACVRTEEFGADVVNCIDMSRGGVSFRSRNPYSKGKVLEIAVPFSAEVKEAPAIFVKGRITNVKEFAGMWRCGVEFVMGK